MQQLFNSSSFRSSLRSSFRSSFRGSSCRGSKVICLITDNHASKLAYRMARALLRSTDELQLVTVVLNEENAAYGNELLAPYALEPCSNNVTPVVLLKGDARLSDTISQYAAASGADLLVMGSHNLCVAGTREDPLPASGSFAMRVVKDVRCCPVLVVKANSRGPYLRSDNGAMGLKVMVECRSTGRVMLEWLMDKMDADRDGIFLAAAKAKDPGSGAVKETAARMLTNFSVQASVNEFYTAQRVYKESGNKALPQAVEADAIDILAVQAPQCKLLPASLTDLLSAARCSVLVFHNKTEVAQGPEAIGAVGADEALMV